MRRAAGTGEDPPHRLFTLQVEVQRYRTQCRIEKGAFIGIVIANHRFLSRHRHLMLMEGAEHPSAIWSLPTSTALKFGVSRSICSAPA